MAPAPTPRLENKAEPSASSPDYDRLARRERKMWGSALVVLGTLTIGLVLTSWDNVSPNLRVLPISLLILVALFAAYALHKINEIAELRGLVRGIEHRSNTAPDNEQVAQLFSLIARSQQGYRELIDTFEDVLFSVTLDGQILTVNRSFAGLLGFSFAELVGHRLAEFVELPDYSDHPAQAALLAGFMERRCWSGVVRVRVKRSGAVHYFDCVLHAIVRDDVVQGISGLAHDITRQREKEMRFTELFQTLREGVYLASADDCVTEVNPALAQMLGFAAKEEMIGVELASFYQKNTDRGEERGRLNSAGFLKTREVTLINRQDGRQITALHTSALIRDAAANPVRYQGTLVDVTEQREMESRLHREQEFARRLIDGFPGLVFVIDQTGRYTFISPQITAVLGYSPQELLGHEVAERIDPQDRDAWSGIFKDLVAERRPDAQVEYRKQHKDGSWRMFRASARPLRDEKGRVQGIIASARDITEEQKLQQQVIQSERLAAMGQMIAGVAHELNNPLTAILGVTELMRDQAEDAGARRRLDLAHEQARRAAQIVQSLLLFSRPTAPRSTLLHISDVVQHTLRLHDHSLRMNQIHVDFLPRPELPTILGDANQLTQVFLNLIVNAEQAIREVRDHGTLRIRIGSGNDRILITFQDDGVGIRRETLPRIFDPFFTTKIPGRGTGLGLSICLAIIREHNGDVSAQNMPDGGSVFTVSLPVSSQPLAVRGDSAPAAAQAPLISAASALTGKRILIVDDDEGVRELVEDGLAARGMTVDCTASAEKAMELIRQRPYHAILCGVRVEPQGTDSGSGFALHDLITKAGPLLSRPAFVLMASDLLSDEAETTIACKGHLLQKPFRISELVSLLAEILSPDAALQPAHPKS